MKDQRYKAVKSLIQTSGLQGLREIFTILPLSVVKQDMKTNYNTLRRRVDSGVLLTVGDILTMAELFEVEPNEVFRLVLADIEKKAKTNRKKT